MTTNNIVKENIGFDRNSDPKKILDIGIGDKLREEGIDAFSHFLYYAPQNFIEKAWEKSHLANHLREKLSKHVQRAGKGSLNPNSIMDFIRDLDTENQKILYKYIIKNHTNKW
jgi:hypothetical protein